MHSIVKEKQQELVELCRRFHVTRLEIFGSAVTGEFDPARSDLDFLVEFEPTAIHSRADDYFGLLFALEKLFQRRVDLVEPGAIRNRFFRQAVNRTRTLLYAA